jgi:hypothetical protein
LTVAVSENIWFVHGLEIEDLNNLAVVELWSIRQVVVLFNLVLIIIWSRITFSVHKDYHINQPHGTKS